MALRIDSSQNRSLYVGTSTQVAVSDGNAIVTGKVGIGTTTPQNALDVVAGGTVSVTPNAESSAVFRRNGNNYISILSNSSNEGGILFGNSTDDNDGSINYGHNTQAMSFATADAERMRITSAGNVGIGTTTPQDLLEVRAADGVTGVIRVQGGKNTVTSIGEVNSRLDFGSNDGSVASPFVGGRIASVTELTNGAKTGLAFSTYQQSRPGDDLKEMMRITNEGNVGIGTTSPGRKLTIAGDVAGDANNLLLSNENDTDGDSASIGFSMLSNNTYVKSGIFFKRTTTQGRGDLMFANNNEVNGNNVTLSDVKMTIKPDGNIGVGTTTPTSFGTGSHLITVQAASGGGYGGLLAKTANVTGQIWANEGGPNVFLGSRTNHALVLTTNNIEKVRIATSGNVGFGDTNPTSISSNTSSITVNSSRADLSGGYITKANGTIKNQMYWDATGFRFDLSPSSGDFNFKVGNTDKVRISKEGNISTPSQELTSTAVPTNKGIYTSEIRLIDTPNGGLKKCRVITDNYGEWILVGRFAASAMTNVAGVWSSESGLDTSTAQDNVTRFSADFGDSFPSEVRIMGATDFSRWRDTRTIDFVYGVPEGRKWKFFFSGGVENGMAVSTKFGWAINGAYDGFGRWINPAQNFVRMSDTTNAVLNPSAAYTTATTNAFNWNTNSDAKFSVSATRVFSGQDTQATSAFGRDDNIQGFFDEYPSEAGNMSGGVDFSSAVWILIKLPQGASSGGTLTDYWVADGNDISNTNSGNVGIGTDSPSFGLTVHSDSGIQVKGKTGTINGSIRLIPASGGREYQLRNVSADFQIRDISADVVRMHFDNDGNTGIGTTTPGNKLSVDGSVRINDSGDGQLFFGTGTLNKIVLDGTNMEFWSGGLAASITTSNQGLIKFGTYGLGGTGTPTALLGVDNSGNVVKTTTASDLPGGPYLPLAGGTMTGVTQFNDHTQHGDQVSAKWGAGNDFTIKHNATDSFVENQTGHLSIVNYANDKDIVFWGDDGTGGISKYLVLEGVSTNAYFSNPGNVGIGVTDPQAKLEVMGTSNTPADGKEIISVTNTAGSSKLLLGVLENNYGWIQSAEGGTLRDLLLNPSGGDVGIGTTSPEAKLHVYNGNASIAPNGDGDEFVIENSGNAGMSILTGNTSNGAIFFGDAQDNNIGIIDYDHNVNTMSFTVAASKAITINASRNVGINTTAPSEKLHVAGNIFVTGKFGNLVASTSGVQFEAATAATQTCRFDSDEMRFFAGGGAGEVFTMLNSTGATTFTNTVTATNFILSSDERLKENIKTLKPKTISAEWKSFNAKNDDSYRTGVIAQDLEIKHPEFVETNDKGFKSVKYIDLLISKIAELEHRIKQLEK